MTAQKSKNKDLKPKSGYMTNEVLRAIFESINVDALFMLDKTGRIVSWNPSAERLTGYSHEEILLKNYSIFFPKNDREKSIPRRFLKLAEKEGQSTAEGVRVRKDGTFYWASSSLSAVHNKEGRLIGFAKVIKDISKEKEEEQKRDEFIGIASHELKNPIATLSLYSELLGERLRLEHDKTNLQMLRDIQSQSARLVTLIDDLMMVSQIDSGKLELLQKEFDLNALIKKTTHHIQSGSTTHKIIRVGTALRHVRGDEDQIGRVLTNLITNAVKYSIRANKIIVRVAKKGTKMIVSVQDFGPGIETVDRNEIFKRFYRGRGQKNGKVAGFGLGLFICSEIIKKHHQKIWVKSKKGLGSTFFFSLASVR